VRVIAVANQKGGCGKTTTAINLTASLAFLHKKVLLIDLDPQGHSTCGLGIQAEGLAKTAYDLFHRNGHQTSISDIVVSVEQDLHLIPSHVVLSAAEQELAGADGRERRLIEQLDQLPQPYDYVVIDCPPNLGLLTYNALRASDEVMIPIEPSFFSLHGLAKIFETLDRIKREFNKTFKIHALLTRYEKRTKLTREIEEEVRRHFNDQLFSSYIRENVRLREAAAAGKSIVKFDRNSTGFQDYMSLAIEMIERGMVRHERIIDISEVEPIPAAATSAADEALSVLGLSFEHEDASPQAEEESTNIAVASEPQMPAVSPAITIEPPVSLAPHPVLGGVLFSFRSDQANEVMVAGDFNRWIAEPLVKVDSESNLWQKIVPVDPGTYRYKFLVDGEWVRDPSNISEVPTSYGGSNSVIEIQ